MTKIQVDKKARIIKSKEKENNKLRNDSNSIGTTMKDDFIANALISINIPIDRVWDALTNPEIIKKYMFGTQVTSDWQEGSSITWEGTWQGKKYEDKGLILKIEKEVLLQYSHFSPLSGMPDKPENYHVVTIRLNNNNGINTNVFLTQDNNDTEQDRKHSEKNWNMMLSELKTLLERTSLS